VLDAVAGAFAGCARVAVADLGCGTGATLRAMAPHLPSRQSWRLVDNDRSLLQEALARGATAVPAGSSVTAVTCDLAGDFDAVLGDCDLVTASALLDLVSEAWLDRLVAVLARRSRPFYAALSYDGGVVLEPVCRGDREVIAAVNRHQRTDKGLGPALGPDAAGIASRRLHEAGFTVAQDRSDWRFMPLDRTIQTDMLTGWAGAAREITGDPAMVAAWLGERAEHVAAGRSHMRVGHVDLFAAPPP
jgi:SAM-dependent methyltransferase